MQHIKKTILTLVALLTMTTQAWADYYVSGNGSGNWCNGEMWNIVDGLKMTESNGIYSITFANVAVPEGENVYQFKIVINNWDNAFGTTAAASDIKLNRTLQGTSVNDGGDNIPFTITATTDVTISFNPADNTYMISTTGMKVGDDANTFFPVDIDWNASTKTGTLTMPAGNVEVSVEYYPEAEIDGTLSGNNVPATTDEPLIVITGEGTLTGGTMQYAISTDGTKAPSEGWGENMPTAAGITESGTYYVWYYIKGDDEHSDSEMMGPIEITIGAAPTYSVSLNKEGLNETEVNAWKAKSENVPEVELGSTDLQGVKKGEKVTVTYTGQKKVIGFKVEKKAAGPVSLIVNPAVGQVIGADGKNYADAAAATAANTTAVAMIAYVGSESECTNGLAIQLNASPVSKKWNDAKTYASGLAAVPGGTWRLPSMADWQNMFLACAVSGDVSSASNIMSPIKGFKEKIAATGTTWKSNYYWTSTEGSNSGYAWYVLVDLSSNTRRADFYDDEDGSVEENSYVLGCLAF